MNVSITNARLYELHVNRKALLDQLMEIQYLPKVKQFYNDNGIRIDTIIKKKNQILSDFFVMEGGNVKFSEGEKPEPILKEGKTKDDYDKTVKEFMDGEVSIKLP